MSVLDWLKQQASTIQQTLGDEMTRYKNRELMEGVVAGCAVVGYANGEVSSAEKQKMMGFLQASEAMKVYEVNQVLDTFGKFSRQFEFDPAIGQAEALKAIGCVNGEELVILAHEYMGMPFADAPVWSPYGKPEGPYPSLVELHRGTRSRRSHRPGGAWVFGRDGTWSGP